MMPIKKYLDKNFIFLFCLISLSASPISNSEFDHPRFVVWNVGQGQGTTWVTGDTCFHFDLGGEWISWNKLLMSCKSKKNKIFLSHSDWDHMSFLGRAKNTLPDACLLFSAPISFSPKKTSLLNQFHQCKSSELVPLQLWSPPPYSDLNFKNKKSFSRRSSNDSSRVALVQNQILLPGDSPKSQEKHWPKAFQHLNCVRVLILGHHGSQTSTSRSLLESLKGLKMAVASARQAIYHHPHASVRALLQFKKIPLLRSEDWGNLIFETSQVDKDGTPCGDHAPQARSTHIHYRR